MKFEYTSYWDSANPNIPLKKRPLIEIELFAGSKSIKIPDALVDSGADYCLFNIAYADVLGIDIGKCPKIYFTGIGGLIGKIPAPRSPATAFSPADSFCLFDPLKLCASKV